MIFRYPPASTAPSSALPSSQVHTSSSVSPSSSESSSPSSLNPSTALSLASSPSSSSGSATFVPPQAFSPVAGFTSDVFARTFTPKPLLCGRPLDVVMGQWRFLGQPTLLPKSDDTRRSELTFFNIVAVLPAGDPHAPEIHSMIETLSAALEQEETRRGYLTQEAHLMNNVRDEFMHSYDPAEGPHEANLVELLVEQSQLCFELATIQRDLTSQAMSRIQLNSWLDLSFSLDDPQLHQNSATRPYQTILLLAPPERILSRLPEDSSSPLLRQLVMAASPTKSLHEISIELDIPWPHLARLTAHLCHWRQAVVIDTLAKYNVYVIHPDAPLDVKSPLFDDFARAFPGTPTLNSSTSVTNSSASLQLSLTELLSRFALPRTLSDHLSSLSSSAQLQLVNRIGWLLARSWLQQLYVFVYLISPIPPPPSSQAPVISPSASSNSLHRQLAHSSSQNSLAAAASTVFHTAANSLHHQSIIEEPSGTSVTASSSTDARVSKLHQSNSMGSLRRAANVSSSAISHIPPIIMPTTSNYVSNAPKALPTTVMNVLSPHSIPDDATAVVSASTAPKSTPSPSAIPPSSSFPNLSNESNMIPRPASGSNLRRGLAAVSSHHDLTQKPQASNSISKVPSTGSLASSKDVAHINPSPSSNSGSLRRRQSSSSSSTQSSSTVAVNPEQIQAYQLLKRYSANIIHSEFE